MNIAAAGAGNLYALTEAVRTARARVDADIPIYNVQILEEGIYQGTWFGRVFGAMRSGSSCGRVEGGLAIGLVAAFSISTVMEAIIVQVDPREPSTLLFTVVALGTIGLAASRIPAERATRVDPVVAIRNE